jgi:hypothetical protein
MTQARIYGNRDLSAVRLSSSWQTYYGFQTNLPAAARTTLGQTNITIGSAVPATVVLGANRPRPPRAKILSSGITSYVDHSVYNSPDIQIVDKGIGAVQSRTSTKSIRVAVNFYSALYCWDMPLWQHQRISSDLGGLGITVLGTSNTDAYLGINYAIESGGSPIYPDRAQKILEPSGDVTRRTVTTTFVDSPSGTALPEGWTRIKSSPWI